MSDWRMNYIRLYAALALVAFALIASQSMAAAFFSIALAGCVWRIMVLSSERRP